VKRPLIGTVALVVVAGAATTSVTVTRALGSVHACGSADCVGDVYGVTVGSGRKQLDLAASRRGWLILDFSPNRKQIVFNTGLTLSTATSSGDAVNPIATGSIVGPAPWSPDGKLIAFSQLAGGKACASHRDLWVVRPTGEDLRKLSDCAGYPAWAPDSKRLAFVGNLEQGSGTLSVINVDGTGRKELVGWRGTSSPTVAWAPHGDRIAFTDGGGSGPVRIVRADGSGSVVTVPHAISPVWRADGLRLAVVRVQRPVYRLEVLSPNGSVTQRVDSGGISRPAWSRDGRLAYVKSLTVRGRALDGIYEARPGKPPRRLATEPGNALFFGVFWSVRGDRVLYLRCLT
jgi:dipeptidyl aminopeptidase/acylaminoacyl peptidase